MTEDRRSRSEIDIGAALNALDPAVFAADELLNCVMDAKELPLEQRIEAFQDASGLMHHIYNATRLANQAFDRRQEWPNLSGDSSQLAKVQPYAVQDAIAAMRKAQNHIERCLPIFVFEAKADPAHWSRIGRAKYESVSRGAHIALSKIKMAIESLEGFD